MGHFMRGDATRRDATRRASVIVRSIDGRRRRRARGCEGVRACVRSSCTCVGVERGRRRGWTRDRDDARRDAD